MARGAHPPGPRAGLALGAAVSGALCVVLSGALGPARADAAPPPALAARARDPAGWWKGRVLADVDVRAEGGLAGLRGRLGALAAAGVGAVVLAPMRAGEGGAIEDHAALDARAGSDADWSALVAAAHAADVAIVVAFELNAVARTHPWFAAAEAGDRLAQDSFVWSDAPAAERWADSERAGRRYYHAAGPERPDLDLRHRPTRARVERAAAGWIERGADGLLLLGARALLEDDAGDRDRPESVALIGALAASLAGQGALAAVDVDGAAVAYAGAAPLVLDGERAHGLAQPVVPAGALSSAERAAPTGAELGVRAATARQAVRALWSTGVVLLPEALVSDAAVVSALDARRRRVAIPLGVRVPLPDAAPGAWAFARVLGEAAVVVVDNGADAPVTAAIDLRALPLGPRAELAPLAGAPGAEAKGGRAAAPLPASSAAAWAVEGGASATTVVFARPGWSAPRAGVAIDRGLAFAPARGSGWSRDVERTLRCARARGRDPGYASCAVPLSDEPLRWHLELASGPYELEVDVEGRARITAEGQALEAAPKRRGLAGAVFVRDGRLTLEASGADAAITEIRVRPAAFRAAAPAMDVRADRVVLRAASPGVVEWRMNRSQAEPPESSPLVRHGAQWEATLGPWPKGAVSEVAWVIRSAEGTFVTAEGGAEVTVAIP